jgi:hypothetical protein
VDAASARDLGGHRVVAAVRAEKMAGSSQYQRRYGYLFLRGYQNIDIRSGRWSE